MSAVEAQKPVEVPALAATEAAPAPVEPVAADKAVEPVVEAPKTDEVKPEGDAAAAVEEKKDEKPEAKPVEPIYSGVLGYKAPGLKNAFRYSKKHFWFGEEAVPASNLREYLRGEKPEVAHSVAAWSSQTGKGLLYFVKHVDQKEHPAGVLNLAYASDLTKDGADAFHFKISGHKHAFEAQSAAERDGWFVAVEKAIADAKEAKEGIESSEGYKEEKEKIGKPAPLAAAAASASAPKKSTDATPKLAETDGAAEEKKEETVAGPARAGSASSSSDEEKKAKKAKSKSRSASRGKRASIFGGLMGKKDKAEQKKVEPKEEAEASKTETEAKEEAAVAAPVAETTTTAPVITTDVPKVDEELKAEVPIPVAEEAKTEEATPAKVEEKPKPTKRGSIFGSVFAKLSSPTHEKKEHDVIPAAPATASSKEAEPTTEAAKPLEEATVAAPATTETTAEPTAVKAEETKATDAKPAVSTPSKEKEHFSFGKLFGSKDRAKSPAATDKVAEPTKVDAVAPKIEDPAAPATTEAVPAATETAAEPAAVEEKKEETTPVKKEKRSTSIFGSLGRTLSKATNKNKDSTPKKETAAQPTVAEEATEAKTDAPVIAEEKKEETAAAPAEKTIGDVVPEAVTVGEAPKSTPAVTSTA